MENRPTDFSRCCADSLRKLIRDGLLRRNNSYDAVFILQLVAVNDTGKFVRLAEVCGFIELDAEFVTEKDGCSSLEATAGVCRNALFSAEDG